MKFTVTPGALAKVKQLLQDKGANGLRIAVVGGGCSGMSYKMELAQAVSEKDEVVDDFVFVDRKSALFLNGSVLEWEEGLLGSGFKIHNPNAKNTCGCGESFTT